MVILPKRPPTVKDNTMLKSSGLDIAMTYQTRAFPDTYRSKTQIYQFNASEIFANDSKYSPRHKCFHMGEKFSPYGDKFSTRQKDFLLGIKVAVI